MSTAQQTTTAGGREKVYPSQGTRPAEEAARRAQDNLKKAKTNPSNPSAVTRAIKALEAIETVFYKHASVKGYYIHGKDGQEETMFDSIKKSPKVMAANIVIICQRADEVPEGLAAANAAEGVTAEDAKSSRKVKWMVYAFTKEEVAGDKRIAGYVQSEFVSRLKMEVKVMLVATIERKITFSDVYLFDDFYKTLTDRQVPSVHVKSSQNIPNKVPLTSFEMFMHNVGMLAFYRKWLK